MKIRAALPEPVEEDGLNAKVHTLIDAQGLPLRFSLSVGIGGCFARHALADRYGACAAAAYNNV